MAELIEQKVAPHFDFERMTRLAVGRNWRQATPEQQKALIEQFRSAAGSLLQHRLHCVQTHRHRGQAVAHAGGR